MGKEKKVRPSDNLRRNNPKCLDNNDFLSFTPIGARGRIVFLHGWGSDAEDLMPIGEQLNQIYQDSLELVSLRAPMKHPDGLGRQWYALYPPEWESVPSAIESLKCRIKGFSNSAIPLEKTVLMGFSQGGAMALHAGCDLPLAGLIGCSAYPHPSWAPPSKVPPVLLFHGTQDNVVPSLASDKLLSAINQISLDSELVLFEGAHEIPQRVLPRIKKALEQWII